MSDRDGELRTWVDGETKAAITDFVRRATDETGDDYVPPAERIAVFDNDGTLWSEKPMPIQLDFAIRRLGELASQEPDLQSRQPYKAAYEKDLQWLSTAMTNHYRGDDADLELLLAAIPAAFQAVTVEEYDAKVLEFFAGVDHPMLGRPYLSTSFSPMIDLLRYLEANGFTNYIASGGDRDFMRPIAGSTYGIPPERVIGSAVGLTYSDEGGASLLLYKSTMDFFDDGPEKPIRIWSRIGRRPIVAVGNSNGDLQMLGFAGGGDRPALRLLILHDDAEREFDYVAGSEDALDAAKANAWTVVSIKADWTEVFNPAG
jgi:phosphoglycolate phosphatase-like HAD superfamily hydrolase